MLLSTHRQTHTHTRTHTQAHKASGTRRGCNLTPRSMQQKILNAFHALRLTLSLSQLLLSLSLPQSLLQSALLLCFPSLSLSHPLSVYPHTQRSAACLRVSSSDVTAAVAVSVDMGVALTATTPTNLLANLGITHTRTHTHTEQHSNAAAAAAHDTFQKFAVMQISIKQQALLPPPLLPLYLLAAPLPL